MAAAGLAAALTAVTAKAQKLDPVMSDYVQQCGGCHGVQGASFPARVPQLRGRAGYFLCSDASRAYILRLPNVALSSLSDARLAATMNFVVFGLGGADAKAARPFTAEEVGGERKHPLTSTSLVHARANLVQQMERRCGVPAAAMRY